MTLSHSPRRTTRRREAGFSFIEILVVMAIITVLVSAVVVVIPLVQRRAKQTQCQNNVRQLCTMFIARQTEKGWPPYNGKNFTLSLVATGEIVLTGDNPGKNIDPFFCPGDPLYTRDRTDIERYKEITKKTLEAGDYHELTSYAGRRNREKDYLITQHKMAGGAALICDDDDGPIHHPDGLMIGYSSSAVSLVEWEELGMGKGPADPDNPDSFLGDNAPSEQLKALWGRP